MQDIQIRKAFYISDASSPVQNFASQFLLPFFLSAIVVIVITVAAERYGTKAGGIIGTLPSTMVVAFILIAINNGIGVATDAVAVVPAEMGINIVFLLIAALLSRRSLPLAIAAALSVWAMLSSVILFIDLKGIILSLLIYAMLMIPSFLFLEFFKKTRSSRRVKIKYTPSKILIRGLLAGAVVATAVSLANIGAALSGIFSVFPAIFLSTMVIFVMEHGPDFAGAMAKSMIFGTPTIVAYATSIYFLYPSIGIAWGTIASYAISLAVAFLLFKATRKMA